MKKFLVSLILLILFISNVYAQNVYNVTFKSDVGMSIVNIKENELVKAPSVTKEGYTLLGWSLDGVMFDFSTPIAKDMELTAVWQKNNDTEESKPIINDDNEQKNVTDNSNIENSNSNNGKTIPQFNYTESSESVKYLIIIGLVLIVGAIKYVVVPKIKPKKSDKWNN